MKTWGDFSQRSMVRMGKAGKQGAIGVARNGKSRRDAREPRAAMRQEKSEACGALGEAHIPETIVAGCEHGLPRSPQFNLRGNLLNGHVRVRDSSITVCLAFASASTCDGRLPDGVAGYARHLAAYLQMEQEGKIRPV